LIPSFSTRGFPLYPAMQVDYAFCGVLGISHETPSLPQV
jgi:hypothetical protein